MNIFLTGRGKPFTSAAHHYQTRYTLQLNGPLCEPKMLRCIVDVMAKANEIECIEQVGY
jgi:hypothetical protein